MTEPPWLSEAMLKYKLKLNHVKLRDQMNTLIPQITDKTAKTQTMMHRIQDKVRVVLDKHGIITDNRPAYHAYALALDKSQRTMEWMVDRIREHQILRETWEERGLDTDILDELDKLLIWNKVTP